MSTASVLAILSAISTLLSIAHEAPAVIAEVKALLAKVAPHVDSCGPAARAEFDGLKVRAASHEG